MKWHGACLCGAVAFSGEGRAVAAHECHCGQCRRWSGHVWAYVTMRWPALHFSRDEALCWYRHSPRATRGFCGTCGSGLFWRPEGTNRVDVSAGALDLPTGLRLGSVSYPQYRGDYCVPGWLK
ncbi:GFA family protein [Paracoccus marinaquae]|uniref:GFA family protein n=1 Tax=Paracoccus marinaquae TaxID=2841926 RepID=A0ABS6ALG7_9RHOB|nr:GFA family protein [Paracoccus marinaquae]MBU3031424.1 GFA family protein [Paracoccus marinaquae]